MTNEDAVAYAQKAAHGDTDAFGVIYDTYVRDVYRFIYYKTHHTETTQDLVAQVFEKALRSIARYRSKQASVRTWLFTIARNSVIDYYRSHRRHAPITDAWDLANNSDMLNEVDVALFSESVQQFMRNLSARERDVLVLRVWEQLSHKEIAQVLDIRESAAKMAYSRAIKRLRRDMPTYVAFLVIGSIL